MRYLLVFGLIIILPVALFAQGKAKREHVKPDTTVYKTVDVQPEFPGGIEKWTNYLFKVPIPKDYDKENTQASFLIQMIIETDGSVTHASVRRKINEAMCKAFIAHVNKSPKWKPGRINGKPVRVLYSSPISCFMLQSDK